MEIDGPIEVSRTAPQQPQDNRAKPTVACLRCRDQKLKCDRELPSCKRCHKQRAACKYPSPPDRKRIAQKTIRSRESLSNNVAHIHRSESPASEEPVKRRRVSTETREHHISNSDETEATKLPSTEVGLLLLEIYFKRIYNSTLLFHKSLAFQLYMQHEIPDYLLRAIFAHAAIFLKQVDSPYKQYIKTFSMPTLYERSWSWARTASQEVLSHADEPTIVRIQALQVLQVYYFSQGETYRAIVHGSLAYRLCQLLGYHRLHEDHASPFKDLSMQFDREMRRRCFWANWCSVCIGGQQLDSFNACESVVGLPLPAKFEGKGSVQGAELKLGKKMDCHWILSPDPLPNHGAGSSSCSLMAELVKILGVWTKVQAFISDSPARPNCQRMNELNKLIELFNPIESSVQLPVTDLCSRAEFYDESPELLTSVCSMYYLSRLLLHASMVPIFSGCTLESPASKESVRENAAMVLEQATRFAELLQQFVGKDLDMTRLWPLSGYGAFVTGSVFMVYNSVTQSATSAHQSLKVPGPVSEEMKTIQTVLGVLSIYWKPLHRLVCSASTTRPKASTALASISMHVPDAKAQQANKLSKIIDAGQANDSDIIASPSYPWSTNRPGHSLEDPSNTTSAPNNSKSDELPLHTLYGSLFSESQLTAEDVNLHENSTEPCERSSGRQSSTLARSATGKAVAPAPDSGQQFASFEDPLVDGNEDGDFDVNWWNTASSINMWETLEMASREPML